MDDDDDVPILHIFIHDLAEVFVTFILCLGMKTTLTELVLSV